MHPWLFPLDAEMSSRYSLVFDSLRATAWLRLRGVSIDGTVRCEGPPPLVDTSGHVQLARQVAFRSRSARSEIGALKGGQLYIGERTFVNQGASIVAALKIWIGDDVRIGDFVAVYDANYHALEPGAQAETAPVTIGDNVWLGRGVIVLPGVSIGRHSVVAAGAVLTSSLPDGVLAAGNPARIIRQLIRQDGWRRG